MLQIEKRSIPITQRIGVAIVSAGFVMAGVYGTSLVLSPLFGPATIMKPIAVQELTEPSKNKIVIPKIGVEVTYNQGESSLEEGAQWRSAPSENPEKGGDFVLAAKRFSWQANPLDTIKKSPFYNLDRLAVGDKVIVDYNGKRYGYEVQQIMDTNGDELNLPESEESRMIIYGVEPNIRLSNLAIVARPLGLVALDNTPDYTTQ